MNHGILLLTTASLPWVYKFRLGVNLCIARAMIKTPIHDRHVAVL